MNENDLKQLEERYFLIKRSQVWAFCGGVSFAAIAFGFISYKGAIIAVEKFGGKQAINRIESYEAQAADLHESIARMAEESRRNVADLNTLVDARIEWHKLQERRIAALSAERRQIGQDIGRLEREVSGVSLGEYIRRRGLIAARERLQQIRDARRELIAARERLQQIDAEIQRLNGKK
jgi:hypothetical protein